MLEDKAEALLNKISGIAALLDQAHSNTLYSKALEQQLLKIETPDKTPSGIIMADIDKGLEFSDLMLKQAKRYQHYFSIQPLSFSMEKNYRAKH